jgi:hypothetical protein
MCLIDEDIRPAIAYFNLRAPESHTPSDILTNKRVLRRFLLFACKLLGAPKDAVLLRLLN